MEYINQIENNIPTNDTHPAGRNRDLIYVFVKGAYPNHFDYRDIVGNWTLRGYSSRAASSYWANANNGWQNSSHSDPEIRIDGPGWSYYWYTGDISDKPLAESIILQHFNELRNSGSIVDFRIRHSFVTFLD
jgi:hypothetical protein